MSRRRGTTAAAASARRQLEDDAGAHASLTAAGLTAVQAGGAGWTAASRAFLDRMGAWRHAKDDRPAKDARGEEEAPPPEVSLWKLFSFSTARERWLMVLGLAAAFVAGLSMPVWLYLLAQSLETFNNIGKIINAGGDISILKDQLYSLIYSFAIVGFVSLVSGAVYVAVFTYTGERQTLRIRERFVRSALRQEAAWFDTRFGGDPQELPTLAANALQRIGGALGRQVADTVANLLSAVGCLAIALVLNDKLALFMLCMLPVVGVAMALVSCAMRRRSGQALENFATAGAFATEVISGIKTVASLTAEPWAVAQYDTTSRLAEKYSISSGFLSKLASGVMGLLFYGTYVFAFIFGTEQAARTGDVEKDNFPFYCMFNYCGISGSEVMV